MPDQTPAPAADQATEVKPAPAADQATEATPAPAAAKAAPAAAAQPPAEPAADAVTADIWALGDHARQVLLAGLLADQPDLQQISLSPADWQSKLDDYARSERV